MITIPDSSFFVVQKSSYDANVTSVLHTILFYIILIAWLEVRNDTEDSSNGALFTWINAREYTIKTRGLRKHL